MCVGVCLLCVEECAFCVWEGVPFVCVACAFVWGVPFVCVCEEEGREGLFGGEGGGGAVCFFVGREVCFFVWERRSLICGRGRRGLLLWEKFCVCLLWEEKKSFCVWEEDGVCLFLWVCLLFLCVCVWDVPVFVCGVVPCFVCGVCLFCVVCVFFVWEVCLFCVGGVCFFFLC